MNNFIKDVDNFEESFIDFMEFYKQNNIDYSDFDNIYDNIINIIEYDSTKYLNINCNNMNTNFIDTSNINFYNVLNCNDISINHINIKKINNGKITLNNIDISRIINVDFSFNAKNINSLNIFYKYDIDNNIDIITNFKIIEDEKPLQNTRDSDLNINDISCTKSRIDNLTGKILKTNSIYSISNEFIDITNDNCFTNNMRVNNIIMSGLTSNKINVIDNSSNTLDMSNLSITNNFSSNVLNIDTNKVSFGSTNMKKLNLRNTTIKYKENIKINSKLDIAGNIFFTNFDCKNIENTELSLNNINLETIEILNKLTTDNIVVNDIKTSNNNIDIVEYNKSTNVDSSFNNINSNIIKGKILRYFESDNMELKVGSLILNNNMYVNMNNVSSYVDDRDKIDLKINKYAFKVYRGINPRLYFIYNNKKYINSIINNVYNAVKVEYTSDLRLKDNINDISGIIHINKLFPKKYNKSNIIQAGFIAQDVMNTDLSFCVSGVNIKSLDYRSICIYMIQAIKELDIKREFLRKVLLHLKNK